MAYETPLRKTFEEAGWQVNWLGSGQPIQVSYGNKTYNISPDQYKIIGGSAYIDPNYAANLIQQAGYQPVRSTLSPKYDVSWDSGQVTVKHPTTGEGYSFKPEFNIAGRTYTTPSVLEAVQSRLTPAYETTYKDLSGMLSNYMAQQQQYFQNYMNQINNTMKQYSDAGIAMLNAYQQQYSQALSQLQQLMQPQTDVPESVKIAIDRLKEQTDENIKKLTEEMNARGILQSGLAADMEAKLRKGALTEQQQLMANWLDQQHQQMFQAAMKMADMQAQYAGNYANLYQQAYLKPLEISMNLATTAYQTQAGLSQQAFDIASKLKQWVAEQEGSARTSRLEREAEAQKQAQQQALEQWKALLPYQYMTPYQQARLQLDQARLASGGSNGGGGGGSYYGTLTDREREATQNLYEKALARYQLNVARGLSDPLYYTVSTILGDPEWVSEAMRTGADRKAVIDALVAKFGKGQMPEKLKTSYAALSKGDPYSTQAVPLSVDPQTYAAILAYYNANKKTQ